MPPPPPAPSPPSPGGLRRPARLCLSLPLLMLLQSARQPLLLLLLLAGTMAVAAAVSPRQTTTTQPPRPSPPQPFTSPPRCLGPSGETVTGWVLLKYPGGETAAYLELADEEAAGGGGAVDGNDALEQQDSKVGGETVRVLGARVHARGSSSDGGEGEEVRADEGRRSLGPCRWRADMNVNDPEGPLRRTLAAATAAAAAATETGGGPPRNSTDPSTGFAFYNDADPEGKEHWGFAHSKGALLFGSEGGVWLTHSFPTFPGRPPRADVGQEGGQEGRKGGGIEGGEGRRHGGGADGEVVHSGGRSSDRQEAESSSRVKGFRRLLRAPRHGDGGSDDVIDPWVRDHSQRKGNGTDGDGTAPTRMVRSGPQNEDEWDVVRHAQTVYGQHALCLSLPTASLVDVATSLLVAQACVYDAVMPRDLADVYGAIQTLIDASAEERHRVAGAGASLWGCDDCEGIRDDAGTSPGGLSSNSRGTASTIVTTTTTTIKTTTTTTTSRSNMGTSGGATRPGAQHMEANGRGVLEGATVSSSAPQDHPLPAPSSSNTSVRRFADVGGGMWLHVTKSPSYVVPYHEQVLEPLLGRAMIWETWRVGPSYPSQCPPNTSFASLNVRRVAVPECAQKAARRHMQAAEGRSFNRAGRSIWSNGGCSGGGGGAVAACWDSLKDHSKWGVSMAKVAGRVLGASQRPAAADGEVHKGAAGGAPGGTEGAAEDGVDTGSCVCLGDLNRQPSQRFRGGGYVCSCDTQLWLSFQQLIADLEPCAAA